MRKGVSLAVILALMVASYVITPHATTPDASYARISKVGANGVFRIPLAMLADKTSCQATVEDGLVRVRDDGSDPTSTSGTPLRAGQTWSGPRERAILLRFVVPTYDNMAVLHIRCYAAGVGSGIQ